MDGISLIAAVKYTRNRVEPSLSTAASSRADTVAVLVPLIGKRIK
jgi:hypothetical protein